MPKILVLSSYFLNVKWKIKAYNKPKQIRTGLISISKNLAPIVTKVIF